MKAEAISSPVWRISKNGDPRASLSNCSAYFFVISSWGFSCSNLYLLPVILLLCFCSPEENLAVLSPITPPPAGDGNEVPSLPALPQALQAQLSHAHHLSHFMCSVAWPPLWPLLGSLQLANSCLVFRGPKPRHSAPHPPHKRCWREGKNFVPCPAGCTLADAAQEAVALHCCLLFDLLPTSTIRPGSAELRPLQAAQPVPLHGVSVPQTWDVARGFPSALFCSLSSSLSSCPPTLGSYGTLMKVHTDLLSRLLKKMLRYKNM